MEIDSATDLLNLSTPELTQLLGDNGHLSGVGVSGYYLETGAGVSIAGVEGLVFVGIDNATGDRVVAHYGGMTVGVAATLIPGFNVGAGVFQFSGSPAEMGGRSFGMQVYSGVAVGTSYSIGGDTVMLTVGGSLAAGGDINFGSTFRVEQDGEVIYGYAGPVQIDNLETNLTVREFAAAYLSAINFGNSIEISQFLPDGTEMITIYTTIRHRNEDGEDVFYVEERTLFRNPVDGVVRPFWVNSQGQVITPGTNGISISESGQVVPNCFLAGTPIEMWDGGQKPIEDIKADDIVMSYDAKGDLVPGRVTKTFRNQVVLILDVFGLMVTPGHVTLCGDGKYSGGHVPIIDILRSDGALVRKDGTLVRAATGCVVGSPEDQMIWVVTGRIGAKGQTEVSSQAQLRLGTRVITAQGVDLAISDIIAAGGGTVTADGLVATQDGQAMPYLWNFGPELPKPEDYVLSRSNVTLEDIYRASEWEGQLPLSPVPVIKATDLVSDKGAAGMRANQPVSMAPKGTKLN